MLKLGTTVKWWNEGQRTGAVIKQLGNMTYRIYSFEDDLTYPIHLKNMKVTSVQNDMYRELECLINEGSREEDAGILLAAIISQDTVDGDGQPVFDRDTFIDSLEGDLP